MADETQDAWQRAQLLLEAQQAILKREQKPAPHPYDVPAAAIERAVADLMHYVHERNKGVAKGSGDSLDFDQILKLAKAQFIREREAAVEKNEPRLDLNKKGAPMPDTEFTAKVPFMQDPEFIKLQRELQTRQEQETKKLLDQQTRQRIEFGRQPGVTRPQIDDNNQRQLKERADQSRQHKSEQDRYTREYHDAKVLREQLRENEKRQELEKGRTR
jgi:hypothetical protein